VGGQTLQCKLQLYSKKKIVQFKKLNGVRFDRVNTSPKKKYRLQQTGTKKYENKTSSQSCFMLNLHTGDVEAHLFGGKGNCSAWKERLKTPRAKAKCEYT